MLLSVAKKIKSSLTVRGTRAPNFIDNFKNENVCHFVVPSYVLLTVSTNPTKIESRRNRIATMMLKLIVFTGFLPLSVCVSIPLFSEDDIDSERKESATSQKDSVVIEGASTSASKIVEESGSASIDINSTQ